MQNQSGSRAHGVTRPVGRGVVVSQARLLRIASVWAIAGSDARRS